MKVPDRTAALTACIDHATDLVESAKLLRANGKPNIAYHLATLALEEIGRRELIGLQVIADLRPVPPSWPHTHTQRHVKKLLWAFFGVEFAQQQLTRESVEEMQSLAEKIHLHRLEGLYVSEEDGALHIPSEAVTDAEAENLINLAEARIGIASTRTFRTDVPDEDVELQDWFLSVVEEEPWKKYIFSSVSMEKLAELHDSKAWIKWLKSQFDEANAKAATALQNELRRSETPSATRTIDKWSIKFRIRSASHSIRRKELVGWNKNINYIQLASPKNDQLLVELRLGDDVPIQGLWQWGWFIARKFVVALNIATKGFWWWRLPEQTERYYEKIVDLEQHVETVAEQKPGRVNWGQNRVLSETELKLTSMCLVALNEFEKRKELEALDRYIGGLTLLSLNEIHWRFDYQAFGMFVESLKAMFKFVGETEPIEDVLRRVVQLAYPTLTDEARKRLITIALEYNDDEPAKQPVALADVGAAKWLCDYYFLSVLGPSLGVAWGASVKDQVDELKATGDDSSV